MTRWNPKANEIFADASEIRDVQARHDFVRARCGDDDDLQRQVESLLHANPLDGDFLSRPMSKEAQTAASCIDAIDVSVGTVIGCYKLLERIGEGGFGVVFMAEQKEPIRRKVALKIIKPGMDTREVIARFEAERQALAMMDHPNIARVFDAGATHSGRPYFVMELVRGVPITSFCDENDLTTNERLELFILVCQAIQHAHQKAIIHRDIKPSNVLITMHDDIPVPKVIDFGIAKCTQSELTQKTVFTHFRQILGTPAYMAPEQVQMSGLDIDTRCDIYALGVLLYELLTGVTPFDAKDLLKGGFEEICRRLREEEPPKPSNRVSTMDRDTRCSLARSRRIDPNKLGWIFRGDLDWITMKAMEKNRTRRYDTANALAADVKRYLSDEPVTAVAPGNLYRLRKFIRRNKVVVAATTALVGALLLGAAVAGWQAYVARTERDRARSAEGLARNHAAQARQNELRAIAETKARRRSQYISDMNAARLAWEENNVSLVTELLERHTPTADQDDLRGFEWYYFWKLGEPRRNARAIGELPHAPTTVSFSSDGTSLAVADRGGNVSIYDVAGDLRKQRSLAATVDWQNFGLFAASGPLIALPTIGANEEFALSLRDLSSDFAVDLPHSSHVKRAVFLPQADRVATITSHGVVTVWSTTGEALAEFRIGSPNADVIKPGFAVSPQEDLLAAGHAHVEIWNIDSKVRLTQLEIKDEATDARQIQSLAFAPDDVGLLYGGTSDGFLFTWRVENWSEVDRVRGQFDSIRCVAHSPTDNILATGSRDNTVRLWNSKTREVLTTLKGHSGIVDWVAFSPDGKVLATASQDYSVILWDISRPTDPLFLPLDSGGSPILAHENTLYCVADGTLTAYDAGTARALNPGCHPATAVRAIAIARDGTLAIAREDAVELWNTGKLQRTLRPVGEVGFEMAISPSGEWLAVVLADGRLSWWDLTDEAINVPRHTVDADGTSRRAIEFGAEGTLLASGNAAGEIAIFDSVSGLEVGDRIRGHRDEVWSLAFHPNQPDLLVSGSLDAAIKIWQIGRDAPLKTLRGHTASVNDLLFSPDGGTLFSAGGDRVIRVWDTQYWDERCVLPGHSLFAGSVAWINETTLVSRGNDGIRFWRAATSETVRNPQ